MKTAMSAAFVRLVACVSVVLAASPTWSAQTLTVTPAWVYAEAGAIVAPRCTGQPGFTCGSKIQDPLYAEASFEDLAFGSGRMSTGELKGRGFATMPQNNVGAQSGYVTMLGYQIKNSGATNVKVQVGVGTHLMVTGVNLVPIGIPAIAQASVGARGTLLLEGFGLGNNPNGFVLNAQFGGSYFVRNGVPGAGFQADQTAQNGTANYVTSTPDEIRLEYLSNVLDLRPNELLVVRLRVEGLAIAAGGRAGTAVTADSMHTSTMRLSVLTPGVEVLSPTPLAWVSVVPEPSQAALLMLGLATLLGARAVRRRAPARHPA